MAERKQGTKLCGLKPRRLLVPTEAEQKSGHRLEQQCGGGRVGTAGESRLSFTDFYTTFLLEKDKMIVLAFSYPI